MEKVKVIIDRSKDGTYNVYCEDAPSFFGMGDTIEEAKLEMLETIRITTEEIGELVMSKLKAVDEVAYVRFASVYRNFEDVQKFADMAREV